LKSLLLRDDDWDEMHEVGYVKQKVSGGRMASKLRAIVPNSTILRLLSSIVFVKVQPFADQYSADHGLDIRVLAGQKGGQPLNIVGVAQHVLQCARDDGDRGAFGHLDVANYHDCISWTEMWRSQRRRQIPQVLCSAVVRLQRCPTIQLCVRNMTTERIPRGRGALTGNRLAPWLGRLIVEDIFTAVQPQIENVCYSFMGVRILPMAWSDNLVAFANSSRNAVKILASIAYQLESVHLRAKEDSLEIVPASSQRLRWPAMRKGPCTFRVIDESKLLGYHVACNGDTSRSRAVLNGALRGRLSHLDRRFSLSPSAVRAHWWKQQFRGYVGFFAAFLGINFTIMRQMGVIANAGARKVCGFPSCFNYHETLMQVRTELKVDVKLFFVQTVVKWLGHCFRHRHQPISILLSLPTEGRLAALRSRGPETPLSVFAASNWLNLIEVGLDIEFPVSGRPGIRGTSGNVIRWGAGWFGPIRDGGVGWEFDREAESEVARRVQILLRVFKRKRSSPDFALEDGLLPISN